MWIFDEKEDFIFFMLLILAFVIYIASFTLIFHWNKQAGLALLLANWLLVDIPVIIIIIILAHVVLAGYALVEMFDWSIIGAYSLTCSIPILIITSLALLAKKKSERD